MGKHEPKDLLFWYEPWWNAEDCGGKKPERSFLQVNAAATPEASWTPHGVMLGLSDSGVITAATFLFCGGLVVVLAVVLFKLWKRNQGKVSLEQLDVEERVKEPIVMNRV